MKSVANVKEMRSTGYEGGGYVLLEFEAGFNADAALADVRAKVDQAKRDLPRGCRRAVGAGGQSLALSGAGGDAGRRRAGAHAAAHRPQRQEQHRAGARRAEGGTARRARRGGRDHRRTDADEELRHLDRSADLGHAVVEQPDRRRRAGRRQRPLRRQGAGPDRAAAGHAEDSDRVDLRRDHFAGRHRHRAADLQGRHLGDARQRQARRWPSKCPSAPAPT